MSDNASKNIKDWSHLELCTKATRVFKGKVYWWDSYKADPAKKELQDRGLSCRAEHWVNKVSRNTQPSKKPRNKDVDKAVGIGLWGACVAATGGWGLLLCPVLN